MKTHSIKLENLTCAVCAGKIEAKCSKINGIEECHMNFPKSKLSFKLKDDKNIDSVLGEMKKIILSLEPDVSVIYEDENTKKSKVSNVKRNHVSKLALAKIIVALASIFITMFVLKDQKILIIVSYVFIGYSFYISSFKNIARGDFFDENFLMTVASLGAILIGEYEEAVAVLLFFSIGSIFEDIAVSKSKDSVENLLALNVETANILRDGEIVTIQIEDIVPKDVLIIKPGDKVPVDGVVVDGSSLFDYSSLTGEPVPKSLKENESVLSGSINLKSAVKIEATTKFSDSTFSKILTLIENASEKKSVSEKFITKFAKYYTPAVIFVALLVAVIPPLVTGDSFDIWVHRALIFLVVSCPCALVISIPLAYFGGIGAASRRGLLIKGSNYLEALTKVDTIVFDKTGTLTNGTFTIKNIYLNGDTYSKEDLLYYASLAEIFSVHPIASAILSENKRDINQDLVKENNNIDGKGIEAFLKDDTKISVGNSKLININSDFKEDLSSASTIVYIAINDSLIGSIHLGDTIKENAKDSIQNLRNLGIKNQIILTGDNLETATKVANEIGIDSFYSQLLPEDKLNKLEKIIEDNSKVVYVGDGINDAPSLIRSDIGISMGSAGSDAAISASDIIIVNDNLESLVSLFKLSKKTKTIVLQNIIFAIGVKLAFMILGVLGIATMWEAVFGDVGVTILAILNTSRLLK